MSRRKESTHSKPEVVGVGWHKDSDPLFETAEQARIQSHTDLSRSLSEWVNNMTESQWASTHPSDDAEVEIVFIPSYSNPEGAVLKPLPDDIEFSYTAYRNKYTGQVIGYCYTFRYNTQARLVISYRWDESMTGPDERKHNLAGSIDVRVATTSAGRKFTNTKHYGVNGAV